MKQKRGIIHDPVTLREALISSLMLLECDVCMGKKYTITELVTGKLTDLNTTIIRYKRALRNGVDTYVE